MSLAEKGTMRVDFEDRCGEASMYLNSKTAWDVMGDLGFVDYSGDDRWYWLFVRRPSEVGR
jgi:hypothetical protein